MVRQWSKVQTINVELSGFSDESFELLVLSLFGPIGSRREPVLSSVFSSIVREPGLKVTHGMSTWYVLGNYYLS